MTRTRAAALALAALALAAACGKYGPPVRNLPPEPPSPGATAPRSGGPAPATLPGEAPAEPEGSEQP
jgi:hypothetical protein